MPTFDVRIPNHTLHSLLGKGGMASVYLATDDLLARPVALKVIDREIMSSDSSFAIRFRREAQMAANLHHPNIVSVYQFGESEGLGWITMAYVDGGSLADRLQKGAIEPEQALEITAQIAAALGAAHAQNIVHRDVKPDNILFQDNLACLADFGIAKQLEGVTQLTSVGSPGTIRYMSPEQTAGAELDQRSDLYALGVVLYEMLTGVHPTGGDSLSSVVYGIAHTNPTELPPSLAQYQPLINNLLAKSPDDRVQSSDDLINQIRDCGVSLDGVVANTTLNAAQAAKSSNGHRHWFTLGVLATIMAAVGVFWNVQNNTAREEQQQIMAAFSAAASADDTMTAFTLSQQLGVSQRRSPEFKRQMSAVAVDVQLHIANEGALVEFRDYNTDNSNAWASLGTTPFEQAIQMPRGVVRLRISKPGYRTTEYAVHVPGPVAQSDEIPPGIPYPPVPIVLQESGADAAEFALIPASTMPIWVQRITRTVIGDFRKTVAEFKVLRREVSNADYFEFVKSGGYENPAFWQQFETPEGPLTLGFVREKFVDATNQPGPSSWVLGTYPEGAADMPVTGVSWYEAEAYARSQEGTLPSVHHWARYALGPFEGQALIGPAMASSGNYNKRGALPVSEQRSLGPWGTFDTAGNVSEWSGQPAKSGRLVLGSAFDDFPNNYSMPEVVDPMLRSARIGFRYIRTSEAEPDLYSELALRSASPPDRQPMSDEAFEVLKTQLTPITRLPDRVVVTQLRSTPQWSLERHQLTYRDGAEFRLYLMRPSRALKRYQAVVYGPHGGAFSPGRTEEDLEWIIGQAATVVRAGRILVLPVWHGSMERFQPQALQPEPEKAARRMQEATMGWYQDSVDTLAYLDTLPDIDGENLSYFGESYGSSVFGVMLTNLHPRFKTAILLGVGVFSRMPYPMLDSLQHAPRITKPVLMINGRHDVAFSYENSQLPLFELLGTAEPDKRLVVFDDGHFQFPVNELSRLVSEWLNRYLRPVQ